MYWKSRKLKRNRLKEQFGKNPLKEPQAEWTKRRMDKIKLYHEEQIKNSSAVDDITWNDLEMDEVFLRINQTKSFMGEQVLYHRLHDLDYRTDRAETERQIEYLVWNEESRIDIEEKLAYIGKREDAYHLPTFLMHAGNWKIEQGVVLHLLQGLLVLFLVGSIVWENAICMIGLGSVAVINLMIYLYMKQQYEVYLFSLGSLKEIFSFCTWMLADEERKTQFGNAKVEDAITELKRLSKIIVNWQGKKYASMSGDLLYTINDYLMGITLLDISVFNHIMKVIYNKQEQVLLLYEFAGKVDMLISIASFRESMELWCEPVIWKNQECHEKQEIQKKCEIRCEAMAHPLLEHPVTNDFVLRNRAMITGANASGKSTFMKALAINVILAQTIHTCVARTFSLPEMSVMTSMSLRDDVLSGESYYVRETKYLKRMLDAAVQQMPVQQTAAQETPIQKVPTLCVIDEILKGTNTKERLAASAAILDYLSMTNCFVLIATHDMELVYDMKEKYEQYYFESQITERDIQFDYRIQKGMGGRSNAIALLSLLEFPVEIVEAAKKNLYRGRNESDENWRSGRTYRA